MAAAYKFVKEAALFEVVTRKKPTFSDLDPIHQQGGEGAAEHVSHPQQIAWKSMCATQEGSRRASDAASAPSGATRCRRSNAK